MVTCNFQICLLSFDTWPTVSPIKAINMLRSSTNVRMMYVTRSIIKTAGYLALSIISRSPIPMVSLKRSRRNLLKVLLSRHDGYWGIVQFWAMQFSGATHGFSKDTKAMQKKSRIHTVTKNICIACLVFIA